MEGHQRERRPPRRYPSRDYSIPISMNDLNNDKNNQPEAKIAEVKKEIEDEAVKTLKIFSNLFFI